MVAAADGSVRGTQSFVHTLSECWRRPSLTALEVVWRWAFGIPALLLLWMRRRAFWRRLRWILPALRADDGDESDGCGGDAGARRWLCCCVRLSRWRFAVHPVAVQGARRDPRNVAVPDLICVFRQFDSFQFLLTGFVEQADFHLGGIGGEHGELCRCHPRFRRSERAGPPTRARARARARARFGEPRCPSVFGTSAVRGGATSTGRPSCGWSEAGMSAVVQYPSCDSHCVPSHTQGCPIHTHPGYCGET